MQRFYRLFQPSDNTRRDWLLLWALMGIVCAVALTFRAVVVAPLLTEASSSALTTATASLAVSPVISVLIAPPAEEIVFRGWLINSKTLLGVGSALCVYVIFSFIASGVEGISSMIWIFPLAIVGIIGAYKGRKALPKASTPVIASGFASTLVFGLIHIFNFKYGDASNFLVILAVLPQILVGLFCLVCRLRVSLLGAIALHAAWNAEIAIVQLLPVVGIAIMMMALVYKIILTRKYWRFL
jgi:membrane protease YdiL (CAAX protease family)